MTYNLLLVGCGNMAGAMLAGWLEAGLVARAVVIKPTPLTFDHPAVEWLPPEQGMPVDFTPDMIVLGVKPQMLGDVLPAYRHYAGNVPFMSLAVGTTLAWFTEALGEKAAVIRTMPNLPATLRKGVTGGSVNTEVTEPHRAIATALLQAIGSVHWIAENQIAALAAISASGPAYVFLLEEVLQQAGAKLGLDPALASTISREMIIGAAALLEASSESATILRARVTSKGGVTEPTINILMRDNALASLFTEALQANVRRSDELAKSVK